MLLDCFQPILIVRLGSTNANRTRQLNRIAVQSRDAIFHSIFDRKTKSETLMTRRVAAQGCAKCAIFRIMELMVLSAASSHLPPSPPHPFYLSVLTFPTLGILSPLFKLFKSFESKRKSLLIFVRHHWLESWMRSTHTRTHIHTHTHLHTHSHACWIGYWLF